MRQSSEFVVSDSGEQKNARPGKGASRKRIGYNLLLRGLLPFALPALEWRARKQVSQGDRWRERLGFVPRRPAGDAPIWVHAASVGEVQAALPLIRSLANTMPERTVLVTTFTAAGARQLRQSAGDRVVQLMLPYDLPGPVNRFLDRVQPAALLVMETELWPNLFREVHRRSIPLLVGSARISDRAWRRYQKIPGLVAETLNCVDLVAAQSEVDAERFRNLGAPEDRVETLGNVKFDLQASSSVAEQGSGLRRMLFPDRPVWLAASTRPGEEEKVLDAFEKVRSEQPGTLLVLAPRHPERASGLKQLLKARALKDVSRSEQRPADDDTDVFILDTLGELINFYAASDVTFVGGSLVPVGGHNLLEPIVLGVPVLTGPYYDNAVDVAEMLLAAGAVRRVADADELAQRVSEILADSAVRARMAERGWRVIETNRGAVDRLVDRVGRLIGDEVAGMPQP